MPVLARTVARSAISASFLRHNLEKSPNVDFERSEGLLTRRLGPDRVSRRVGVDETPLSSKLEGPSEDGGTSANPVRPPTRGAHGGIKELDVLPCQAAQPDPTESATIRSSISFMTLMADRVVVTVFGVSSKDPLSAASM